MNMGAACQNCLQNAIGTSPLTGRMVLGDGVPLVGGTVWAWVGSNVGEVNGAPDGRATIGDTVAGGIVKSPMVGATVYGIRGDSVIGDLVRGTSVGAFVAGALETGASVKGAGALVGYLVELWDGAKVGATVGNEVGRLVVGTRVGLLVGTPDGAMVGALVGAIVGNLVGA
jgi:hypothetical protein